LFTLETENKMVSARARYSLFFACEAAMNQNTSARRKRRKKKKKRKKRET